MSENDYLEEKLSRARFLNAVLGVVVIVVIAGSAWVVNDQRLLLGAPQSEVTERNVDYREEALEQKQIAEQSMKEAVRQRGIAEKQMGIAENTMMIAVAEKEEALKAVKVAEVERRKSEKHRKMAEEHEQIARAETRKAEEALDRMRKLNEQLKKQLTISELKIKELEAAKPESAAQE